MLAILRLLTISAVFGLLLAVPGPMPAQGSLDTFTVKDAGGFFSKEAIAEANQKIATIKRDFNKDVLIETYAQVPDDLKATFDKEGKEKFFANWAKKRYEQQRVSGISVLLCKNPQYLYINMGKETAKKAFTDKNRNELRSRMTERFKAGEFDKGLLEAVNYIGETFQTTIGPRKVATTPLTESATAKSSVPADGKAEPTTQTLENSSILGWVCVGLVGLLVLWVVIGLIRALTGAGRPVVQHYPAAYQGGQPPYGPGGPGMPPPGYAPPQPAQGGGFLSSLVGGMFGAAAGMAAYNYFTSGSMMGQGGGMTPNAYGGSPAPDDTRAVGGDGGADWGNAGATSDGGGADWGGSDGGGGDWGGSDGGGGDWGGGGDGGGGDW